MIRWKAQRTLINAAVSIHFTEIAIYGLQTEIICTMFDYTATLFCKL